MFAVGAPAPFGVEQRAACVCRAPSRGRRRAEGNCRSGDRAETDVRRSDELRPRCSTSGGVMSPARTRGCVSRWFDTGCATMLNSRLGVSNRGGAARAAIGFHVVQTLLCSFCGAMQQLLMES